MDHPQQTKIRSMIELLHRRLQEANQQGKAALEVEYKNVRDGVGVYIEGDKTSKGKYIPTSRRQRCGSAQAVQMRLL